MTFKKFLLFALIFSFLKLNSFGEGTQVWQQNNYEEFSKGTPRGIAIRSDGSLEVAPSFKPLFTSPSTYIWSIVSDNNGNVYVGTGSPARIYRITNDGKASIIFQPKELQVQALALNSREGKNGVLYAATSPDGKIYRIERGAPPSETEVSASARAKTSEPLAAGDSPSAKVGQTRNSRDDNEKKDAVVDSKAGDLKDKTANKTTEPKDTLTAENKQNDQPLQASVPVDSAYGSSVVFDPKTKYIWDIAFSPANDGKLYVATGDRGEIFVVNTSGNYPSEKKSGKEKQSKNASTEKSMEETTAAGSLFFKSDESHIRTLAFDGKGSLIAGSDGNGLIYRISAAGEGFVLYSAPKKEITALAVDEAGNIYAAGVGEKHGSISGPALSIQPSFSAPGSPVSGAIAGNPPQPGPFSSFGLQQAGGSEIYKITADGSPHRIWISKDDLVYALAFDTQGRLLAGSGNKGRVIAIETGRAKDKSNQGDFLDLAKASASQVTGFAKAPGNALYVATSNLGKVFVLGPALEREGTFESDVFDAHNFSLWGRAEVRGSGNFELYTRSGNVDNPDRNWSVWNKVDLAQNPRLNAPPARFIQWKAVIKPSHDANLSRIESVALNYLPKNVAPAVEEVSVQVGARFNSSNSGARPVNETVLVGGRQPGQNSSQSVPRFDGPLPAQRDRGSIAVRWTAHDANDDALVYSLYYKGDGESRWKLLKENLTDKFYSWDAGLLPDGGYTVRVVASDAPSHSPEEALSNFKDSARFEVDSTPPRIESLNAKLENGQLHISFSASDTFSPIHHAEFSVDAGEWQYVEPVGGLSDALVETYDFNALVPRVNTITTDQPNDSDKKGKSRNYGGTSSDQAEDANVALSNEHVVVVRVSDRYENVGTAKVVVK